MTNAGSAGIAMSVYNQVELTRSCLDSIFADVDRPSYSIAIVDNGSTDETLAFLQKFAQRVREASRGDSVEIIHNKKNEALAKAWNQALAALDTEWRIVISNDVLVPRNWWQHLHDGMKEHKLQLAAPYILEGEIPADLNSWVEKFRQRNANRYWREYSFVMFALRASLLKQIGFLDEEFKVGGLEDTDYIWRMKKANLPYGIVGSTAVFHLVSRTMDEIRQRDGDGHFVKNLKYFRSKWNKDPRVEENSFSYKMNRRWRRWKMYFGYM